MGKIGKFTERKMENSVIRRSFPDELYRILGLTTDDRVRDIFLCGKGEGGLRDDVRSEIEKDARRKTYNVYYPEDMFYDLLHGHQKRSLLDLERNLAASVDLIAIIVESPGAIAELGSFVSIDSLLNKLIVFNDKTFIKDRSYINYGPIRKLQESLSDSVVYVDFKSPQVSREVARRIVTRANRIKHRDDMSANLPLDNMAMVVNFCYLAIVVLGPVQEEVVGYFINKKSMAKDGQNMANSALRYLQKQNYIYRNVEGWLAVDSSKWISGYKYSEKIQRGVDDLRQFWLNLKLRKGGLSNTAQLRLS